MARRNGQLIESILRFVAAILVDTLAFVIWNLASRSPAQLVRDLIAGARRPGTLLRGLLDIVVGLLLIAGSGSLLSPLALRTSELWILMTWTLVTGLLVEQLVGADIHARFFERKR